MIGLSWPIADSPVRNAVCRKAAILKGGSRPILAFQPPYSNAPRSVRYSRLHAIKICRTQPGNERRIPAEVDLQYRGADYRQPRRPEGSVKEKYLK